MLCFSMKLESPDVDYGLEEAAFYEGPPHPAPGKGGPALRKTVSFCPPIDTVSY